MRYRSSGTDRLTLRAFVDRADAGHRRGVVDRGVLAGRRYLELELVSQTWAGTEWVHRLLLFEPPPGAPPTRQGFLFLSGDDTPEQHAAWRAGGPPPGQSALFSALAREVRGPIGMLLGVPNEPLFGLQGDPILAHTLVEYLRTRDPEATLLFPMVKSAVRALDAFQAAAREHLGVELDAFTLAGASKRAWTAWLVAAIDERVTALVALVMDALNMAAQIRYQREAWGAISPALHDYEERGLFDAIPADDELRRLLDPYEHRSALALPKLAVVATNDAVYPFDSLPLYWDDMPGPKHVLVLPDADHSLGEHAALPGTVRELHESVQGRAAMPELEWRRSHGPGGLGLELRSSEAPSEVRLWSASSDTRDFRLARWSATALEGDGASFRTAVRPPTRGFAAHFAEAIYPRAGSPVRLSTTAAVVDAAGTIVSPGREGSVA